MTFKSLGATAPCSKGRRQVARTAVCPASQAHPVAQERTDAQDAQASLAPSASQDHSRMKSANTPNQLSAKRARQAHPDQQAHQDHQEDPDPTARTATPAKMEALATQDQPAQPDRKAQTAAPARRDPLVNQPPAAHRLQATPDPLAKMDHQAQPAPPARQATTEDPARPDPKDHPAQAAHQAPMPAQATKAHPAPMETEDSLVFAPSTALPMAASSSRMAHDDKRVHDPSPTFPDRCIIDFGTSTDYGNRRWFISDCLLNVLVVLVFCDTAKRPTTIRWL